MRKGFVYVRLQIYFTLLVLVIGGALFLTWTVLQKNLRLHAQLKENLLVQTVLDRIVEDLKYADSVTVYPDRAEFVKDDVGYIYFLNNWRLTRRKDANLYLTPAKIILRELSFAQENGLLCLVLAGENQRWERIVRL
ncbi:MAG: hypothetical protein LBD62_01810 [Candidatus Margulisbacteria bacterium]|jgi:hypothetical protein|nr:hypothetical protein [Candidatus Margulisiibacteriota bacterium]